jgi:hypothetical protein
MLRIFAVLSALMVSMGMMAQMEPIYYEGFSKCLDEEEENYGYTGGNDGQWGGDIAKAVVIYQDAPEWSFNYCNGAYQCLKVGTADKQGSATTPLIACQGEAVLTFRVAPWEDERLAEKAFYVSIQGATTTDQTAFTLEKHKWTDVTIRLADIKNGIRVTFSSTLKLRFFLDDVCVRPTDPDLGVIRTEEGSSVDFGLVGCNYGANERTIHVEGVNLSTDGITASLEEGDADMFLLDRTQLSAGGGLLTVTAKSGATPGIHGCYLLLSGKDVKSSEKVEKRITLKIEVSSLDLAGSGMKSDPYTCADVVMLASHEGTVWTDTYYWVTGFVLGGVHRYEDKENGDYDGISFTDKLSLVLADNPQDTDDEHYVTVQISDNARAALNVVDNPELIGQPIKVQGLLLNNNANPLYLGKPGVRNVRTDAQYVRPDKGSTAIKTVESKHQRAYDNKKVLRNGQIYILRGNNTYTINGIIQ